MSENPRQRILVVDDEPQILRVLRRGLESHGFEVVTASNAKAALELWKAAPVTLVVTDLRMPEMDGVELCARIRRDSLVPILILSVKGDEATKVRALDSGADDYVTKPFGMDELLARIRALSRRAAASPAMPQSIIETGDFHIDVEAHAVTVRGRQVHLTPKEFELLVHFARRPGKVITHRALLSAVWGDTSLEQNEYLRVFVAQLRKKLDPDGDSPRYIVTEPWVGYRFEPGD